MASSALQSITLLGATGSIGQSTLKVVDHAPERFRIEALTAHDNAEQLIQLAKKYRPAFVAIGNEAHYGTVKDALSGQNIEIAAGPQALVEAALRPSDTIVAGIVGAAGLAPTYAALQKGRRVLLANKECLVCAGPLFMQRAQESGALLLPIDSEHNAIFQLLGDGRDGIDRIVLTASGGPFRHWTREEMARATPAQATAHPTWKMGAKISVDSATMMNKGLEMIEAHYLFDLPEEKIDVLVHPQSIIHGLVHYVDGSTLAHFSATDMCVPIAHALAWPSRSPCPQGPLDLTQMATMEFFAPDPVRFPALAIARGALRAGPAAALAMNAANEVAVAAFLQQQLGFLEIADLVADRVAHAPKKAPSSIEEALQMDAEQRTLSSEWLGQSRRAAV